ncbi:MAG: PspC domain-containing protein [Candidatus Neomarinimicrobiota bacterium]|jgi:phage shock protein C
MKNKRLYRSIDNAIIGGVMAGFADFLNMDVSLVRVLYVIITLFTALLPTAILYAICWVIIPSKNIFPKN